MKTLELDVDKSRKPGSWWPVKGGRALWSCPGCGRAAALVPHQIYADGTVLPSVVCGSCDFHEYVTLDECQPEVVNSGHPQI